MMAIVALARGVLTTDLTLNRISASKYPHAKCLDGTPPAYYWRAGRGADADASLIIFFQ